MPFLMVDAIIGNQAFQNRRCQKCFSSGLGKAKTGYNLLMQSQAAQTLFVIYISESIALRFEPFKRMYENGSKIALNSTCSKGLKKRSLP